MFQPSVELHGFRDEEDLESIEQTLGQTLLVDKVASLNLVIHILALLALLPILVNECSKRSVAGLGLLFALTGEASLYQCEVIVAVEHS